MATATFLLLAIAFAYAVAPYALLWVVATSRCDPRPLAARLVTGTAVGLALFVLVAVPFVSVRFDLYRLVHAAATVGAVVMAAIVGSRAPRGHRPGGGDALAAAAVAVVVLAVVVRAVPLLAGGDSLGGNDARFHNILARKIVLEDGLGPTWAPVAPVAVVYPRGAHVLCAFLARTTGADVHEAFNALFPLLGGLTAALVHALGRAAFASRSAGVLAAAAYAFLPRWGSLDYFRWGGLPNALGMALVCLAVWAMLSAMAEGRRPRGAGVSLALAGGSALAASALVHHYSFLVGAIVVAAAVAFVPRGRARCAVLAVAGTGAVLAAPWIVARYLRFVGEIGTTSVLVFREPPLTLWDCARSLGPGFVALFVLAWVATRRASWTAERVLVVAWFAALLSAFVFLEYVYRAGSLVATGGADFFTAFTPSRMATDLAYPMSVLIGGLAVSHGWRRWRAAWIAAMVLLAVATCAWVWREQWRVGVYPDVRAAGMWIRTHTREDGMVVGRLPHLGYLTWREAARPVLPASEPRNHPDLAWKERMRGLPDWAAWSRRTGRPVYFVGLAAAPPPLPRVFASGEVGVWELSAAPEVRTP